MIVEENPVLRSLRSHRSIRRFTSDPITEEQLTTILETAQRASTSSNLQAYSVIVVRDAERKRKLAAVCGNQQQIIDCPVFLAFCADLNRGKVVCDEAGYPYELRHAEPFIMSVIDTAIFGQTAMVAAEGMGLGCCFIGAARNHPFQLAEILGLPPYVFVVFGMTLGHPDTKHPSTLRPRLPHKAVVHREQYDSSSWKDAHREYDEAMKKTGIYAGRRTDLTSRLPGWTEHTPKGNYGWIEHSARRWIDPAASRPDVRPFLDKQKIGLE
jgi:FMN reductase [NAD(P)H]